MRTRFAFAAFGALLLVAHPVAAQGDCEMMGRAGSDVHVSNRGTPTETAVMTRPDLLCTDGRRIIADQGTFSKAANRFEFFGNVQVSDPQRTLTAERTTFFTNTKQLAAVGRAVLRDHETGSVIRGDLVNVQEKTAQREARIEAFATSGVAQAVLVREAEAGSARRDTTVVDAQQITIIGERSFEARGNATMKRDSLNARGFTIEYSQEAGRFDVAGAGRVTLPQYELLGDSITAEVGDDDEIRAVLSRHMAQLISEDMKVRSDAVRVFFENGGVTRLVSMNWQPRPGGQRGLRPRVEAREFNMESDSIDVLAPDQKLVEAVAIGAAYGERVTPDSIRQLLPEASADVLAVIGNDWMRGDTVRAFFADNPDPKVEERVMERLQASGMPAQSMYRVRDEQDPAAKLSINYLIATNIEVAFRDGAATLLRAAGDARGLYLQPEEAARRSRAGGAPAPQTRRHP